MGYFKWPTLQYVQLMIYQLNNLNTNIQRRVGYQGLEFSQTENQSLNGQDDFVKLIRNVLC